MAGPFVSPSPRGISDVQSRRAVERRSGETPRCEATLEKAPAEYVQEMLKPETWGGGARETAKRKQNWRLIAGLP